MKNIPERIFLTIGDSEPMPDDFKEFDTEFVCWCEDRIHKDDLEYRLVSKYKKSQTQECSLKNGFYKPIFDIDNGVNTDQDEKRSLAAKECFEHLIDFVMWYSGMEREKIVKQYEKYINEEHECKYCGCKTNKPDNECYKRP
jgi:hypothetical protein